MGGSPASWRTAEGDADRNPGFLDVWMNDFDAISPWTIGRYETEKDADRFCESKMKGDFDLIQRHNEEGRGRKVDYIPVVFPGGSVCFFLGYTHNRMNTDSIDMRRDTICLRANGRSITLSETEAVSCGSRSLTRKGSVCARSTAQCGTSKCFNYTFLISANHLCVFFLARYDEGTAFMPVVEHNRSLPESGDLNSKFRFMALDEDGYDCPSDWLVHRHFISRARMYLTLIFFSLCSK